jgi:hypothetical protein
MNIQIAADPDLPALPGRLQPGLVRICANTALPEPVIRPATLAVQPLQGLRHRGAKPLGNRLQVVVAKPKYHTGLQQSLKL